MDYLFKNCNFIALPYLEIYQSGVLAKARQYKLPIITTKIKYFIDYINLYPSFGYSYEGEKDLKLILSNLNKEDKFYKNRDIMKFKENYESKINNALDKVLSDI